MTYVTGESVKPVRRIGLLGGTFDPPHLGHLIVADAVRDRLGLDEVRFVVANLPWQKEGTRAITDAGRRLELVAAAIGTAAGLVPSGLEIELGGPSYAALTVAELDRREPGTSWHLVVGADAAAGLDTWHRPEDLRRAVELVVVARPGAAGAPPPGWRATHVETPLVGISSTMVRRHVAEGRSIRFLCPDPVVGRIHRWGLYRPEP